MIQYRLLGPLEAVDGDTRLPLGGRKPRALFARLLLDANRTVSVERLVDDLWGRDEYLVMTDFPAYAACQREVARAFTDEDDWSRRAGLNIARVGSFSSDRTVREYAREIWGIEPVDVPAEG